MTTTSYTGSARGRSYAERRAGAILHAQMSAPGERTLPDVGPCIGRICMGMASVNLPGAGPMTLFGFVPRLLAGRMDIAPSWDMLEHHFKRRELRQDREKLK